MRHPQNENKSGGDKNEQKLKNHHNKLEYLVTAGKDLKGEFELAKIRDKFSDEKWFQTVGLYYTSISTYWKYEEF